MKAYRQPSTFISDQRGFTLIEILIAITLMSVLMIGVYSITNSSTETKEKVINEDRDHLQVISAFSRLDRDFSQIYSPLYHSHRYRPTQEERQQIEDFRSSPNRFEPNEKYIALTHLGQPIPNIDNPDKNTLIFKSSVNKRTTQNSKQSQYVWIRYRLISMESSDNEENSNRKGLYQLMRGFQTEDVYNPEFDWNNYNEYILLKNIKSFEFLFWNKNAAKFVSSIKELNENDPVLRLIQIKMVWVDENGIEKEYEKSFRTLMPFFDTAADRDALLKSQKTEGEGGFGGNDGFGGGPNDGEGSFDE